MMRSIAILLVLACLSLMAVAAVQYKPEDFLIPSMPDLNATLNFKIYSGYLPADNIGHKYLFFFLALSQNAPETDPVVMWLNGGPGCSSLEGLFNENGPFTMATKGASIGINQYSWNRVASVLYIESPAFVGFSYSNDHDDLNTNDNTTSNNLVSFLVNFFDTFKSLNNGQRLYLSGESYAGHYLPQLAYNIVQYNMQPYGALLNLKGFLAGDPWTDTYNDNLGSVEYWQQHHIISDANANCLKDTCDFNNVGPLSNIDPAKCDKCSNAAHTDMAGIWIYNIWQDLCYETYDTPRSMLLKHLSKRGPLAEFYASRYESVKNNVGRDPCDDVDMGYYNNRADVQTAFHVKPTKWQLCSSALNYDNDDVMTSVIPVYKYLLSQTNVTMLVFSGDMDAIVPFTGSRRWISTLPLGVPKVEFKAWSVDKQVGGFVTEYDDSARFTFTTVRGAGHMVPADQGARALYVLACRISDQPLSKCTFRP